MFSHTTTSELLRQPNKILRGDLRLTSTPSMGSSYSTSRFILRKPELNDGLLSHYRIRRGFLPQSRGSMNRNIDWCVPPPDLENNCGRNKARWASWNVAKAGLMCLLAWSSLFTDVYRFTVKMTLPLPLDKVFDLIIFDIFLTTF